MSGETKLSPLRLVILGMRMAGHSNAEIAWMLAKAGFHVTTRETVGSLVSQMRRAGVSIPPLDPRESRVEVRKGRSEREEG